MTDWWVVISAVSACAGALVARSLPVGLALAAVLAAYAFGRRLILVLAVALLSSALAATAWAGLRRPVSGPVRARVVLASDPKVVGGVTRVDAKLGHRRVQLVSRGSTGQSIGRHLAGESALVSGRLGPITGPSRSALAVRHIAARLAVAQVSRWSSGSWPSRAANRVRRTLVGGAVSLPAGQRALFSGFVLGDDRGQDPIDVDRFRAAGLSHLLVVSGENIAFVLTLVSPLLRRLGFRARLIAGVGVLLFLGVLTRWEPSVVRALFMAGAALIAEVLGRPISAVRSLAIAVTAAVLLDPLLVHSVGFRLSVGACAGIALLGAPLRRRLPAPAAITLAAQAGVAPVLIPVFGAVPVASLPANLLAAPVAGPVMMWGVVGGLLAGIGRGRVAVALHLPTRLLVGWIALVARVAASAPLGGLGLLAVAGAGAAAWTAARTVGWLRVAAVIVAAGVVLEPSVGAIERARRPLDGIEVAAGTKVWRRDGATIVVSTRPGDRARAGLRRYGINRADVVVSTRSEPVIPARRVVTERGVIVRAGPLRVLTGTP